MYPGAGGMGRPGPYPPPGGICCSGIPAAMAGVVGDRAILSYETFMTVRLPNYVT